MQRVKQIIYIGIIFILTTFLLELPAQDNRDLRKKAYDAIMKNNLSQLEKLHKMV